MAAPTLEAPREISWPSTHHHREAERRSRHRRRARRLHARSDGYFENDDLRPHLRGRPSLRAARARGDRPRVQALDPRQPPDPPRDRSSSSRSRVRPSGSAPSRSCSSARTSSAVVNACDAGREGELIFREIVEHLGSTKPIRRLWLQSMTEDAIRDGFAHLRPGEELEDLGAAAACRARSGLADRHERDARAHQAAQGPQARRRAWSAGRVQTPTLALLVERELEVLAHTPKALLAPGRHLRARRPELHGHLVRPGARRGRRRGSARRPDLRRGARARDRRGRRGPAGQRRTRRASRRARRRRRSST